MNDKERVALHAAQQIQEGMLVGLGTGSTANYFIQELARRRKEEGLNITTVASSVASTNVALECGLPIVAMEHIAQLDVYVDGADEVTPDLTLLKGRGYDLVREKLLARAADRFLVLVDSTKLVRHIGEKFPIPVEVTPFAWRMVQHSLEKLGGTGSLRQTANKDGFVMTSHGSMVLDMQFAPTLNDDLFHETLNDMLNNTPGVVEHGIFHRLASVVMLAVDGQVEERPITS